MASARSPHRRSAIDVWSRNRRRRGRSPLQHLGEQVVGDDAVVAGELGDEALRIRLALEAERGEPQAGGPAFGAPAERLHELGAELQPVREQQLVGLRARGRRDLARGSRSASRAGAGGAGEAPGPSGCPGRAAGAAAGARRARPVARGSRARAGRARRRAPARPGRAHARARRPATVATYAAAAGLGAPSAARIAAASRPGRSSPASSETQATVPGCSANVDESRIVFPLPAGPQTRVSGPSAPRSSAARSRGRGTIPRGSGGIASCVVTSAGDASATAAAISAAPGRSSPGDPRAGHSQRVTRVAMARAGVRSACAHDLPLSFGIHMRSTACRAAASVTRLSQP